MFKIDQFTAANEAAIDQFANLAQLSLANLEKFAQLGLSAARENVEQATAQAQALAGARDVHEVIALSSAAVEPVIKRAYAYSRTVYETTADTNNEVKRTFEKQAAEINRAAVAAFEEAFKYAPTGSEAVVENVKTAFAAAQGAYDNLASINRQIYDTVEKTVEQNVATAQAATEPKRAKKR
ncbi:MAG TPA: phasin family protein [Usitatibacter sp.]|jgi:phasin family protein|nr:phasin family protein [Usitatibacter sp.]